MVLVRAFFAQEMPDRWCTAPLLVLSDSGAECLVGSERACQRALEARRLSLSDVLAMADPSAEFEWRQTVQEPPSCWDCVAVTHPQGWLCEAYRDEVLRCKSIVQGVRRATLGMAWEHMDPGMLLIRA